MTKLVTKLVIYPLAALGAWVTFCVAITPLIDRLVGRIEEDDDDLVGQIRRLPPPPLDLTEACIRRVELARRNQP